MRLQMMMIEEMSEMDEMNLDITVKRIFRLKDADNLKAFADILINDALLIKGLRVVDGSKGLFVAMPSEQSAKDNKWYDTIKCLKPNVYQQIATQVLEAYEKA